MTKYETGTTSEDWGSGSFMHESGAHPAYFLASFVLGVRTGGIRDNLQLNIQPRLADLREAKGVVLTEYGKVPVSWTRNSDNLEFSFEIPAQITAQVSLPCGFKYPDLVVNGRTVIKEGKVEDDGFEISNRYLRFNAPSGIYTGKISDNE